MPSSFRRPGLPATQGKRRSRYRGEKSTSPEITLKYSLNLKPEEIQT
jgi:hypothetical protein